MDFYIIFHLFTLWWIAHTYGHSATFQRDAVERIPFPFFRTVEESTSSSSSSYYDNNSSSFGSKSLPLRNAVEAKPETTWTRLPLRDAVEKRPPPPATYRIMSHQKQQQQQQQYRLLCYLDSTAAYRREPLAFHARDLNPFACTHMVYAFATIDAHTYTVQSRDYEYDVVKGGYRALTGLKRLNPALKVLISIGDDREEGGAHKYSEMALYSSRRRDFIRSLLQFLHDFDFDGVDLHWQYPGAEELGGRIADKNNFNLLLEELSEIFKSHGWILSVSVPASRFRIEDGYNVEMLSGYVDFVNLHAFDFHVEKEPIADHHSPLYKRDSDQGLDVFFNVDYSVRYWLKRGLARAKLNLGVPFHGRSFTLRHGNETRIGAGVRGVGREGFYTQTPGLYAYYEICDAIQNEGWNVGTDDVGSPFAFNAAAGQWVGYENRQSIEKKISYVKEIGLGGVSVWALDLDDFHGLCGETYPLLNAVKRSLNNDRGVAIELQNATVCKDGLYSDPNNCARYTICKSGRSYSLQCAYGKMFDPVTGRCGYINETDRCKPGHTVYIPTTKSKQLKDNRGSRIVCYMTNWAFYRKMEGKFVPEHLDTRLCTHIIYAFASLQPDHLMLKEFDPWADLDNNLYERTTSLPDASVLLALGGWTDSSGDKYSRLVSDGSARRKFVLGAISFLRRHNFHGLHLDWTYPVCWQSNCNRGPSSDKPNYTKLVQELRAEFDRQQPALLLSMSVSGYKEVIDVAYDLDTLGQSLDFITVMTYDYHGHWERKTGHVSPLYHRIGDKYLQYNTNYTMEYLVSKGAPRDKLLVGIPFYGQTFTLNANGSEQGVATSGPGQVGEYTNQPGMLAYYEICWRIQNQRWRVTRDHPQKATGPYAYQGDQWVSYDDPESIREKTAYIKTQGYGGAVAWTVDLDDFSNRCCSEPFPLLKALNRGLGLLVDEAPTQSDCKKPPEPVTPAAPTLTTGVDTGAITTTTLPTTTSTMLPWWMMTTTTTTPTTTLTSTMQWWKPSSPATTTIPPPGVVMPEMPPVSLGQACEPGSYFPDTLNCNAYYRCIMGEKRKQYCAGGLHWNNERLFCDWPAEAKCQQQLSSTTTTTTTTTTSVVTSTEENRKPKDCAIGQYYPHELCNHFYICVNGVLVKQKCGSGLNWNAEKNSCDWAFRSKCATTAERKKNNNAKPSILSHYKTQLKSTCEDGTYSPFNGDCSQYLMCLWGKYQAFSCANGLYWNDLKKICDWPVNAKCDSSTINEDDVSIQQSSEKPMHITTTTTTTTTSTEKPEPLSGYYKIVCYFTNWAWYRSGPGKYTPNDIDPNLCTHIVYGFAVLDYERLVIKAHDSWADYDNKFYERVTAYKAKGLKVSLALGGWNDSAGDKYSRLVNSATARARFIEHVVQFLDKYGFDGLDLDWEYPKCWQVDCNKGPDSDKESFAAFVQELHVAFRSKGYLLSAAVSPSKTVIDAGYDVKALGQYLDWVAVMCYDYHGQWDKKTGHVAPLYLHPDDDVTFFNANFTINYWISEGLARRKIVMGMPLYGQSFQLENASGNGLNAPAPGPGQAGQFTRAAGFLAYYEICDRVLNMGWTIVQDPEYRMGPYAYKGNQWVSFDDPEMIRRKVEYIRDMDLGGGMIWALDLDDFRNRCGQGVHPLMNVIRNVLKKKESRPVPISKPVRKPTTFLKPETTTTTTTTILPASEYKVVCYFTNWAWYRQGLGKFVPSDIDPNLCTHIVYGFAVLNGDELIIKPHDAWADFDNKFYEKITEYKTKGIKVLIAIGGWNDSAGDKYSRLVNNPSARRRFIAHVIQFIETNNFDGLDLDWEYPKCWQVDCKKGPDSDKESFAAFVRELREAFTPRGWLLSAAVSPAKKVIDVGYDVPTMSKYMDWIAVMCYDYHGQWDKITGHVAPMYAHAQDIDITFNANFSINYWIGQGADRRKLIMGMPMYGQSFSLADNKVNGLNSPTYGGGEAGDFTRARGFLSYYEICSNIVKKGWQVVRDRKGRMGPYAYHRDQWVSFDDIAMIQHKSEFIRAMGLGGGMIWALDLDDFRNTCGCETYPLLKTINRILRGYPGPQPDCNLKPITMMMMPLKKESNKNTTMEKQCDEGHLLADEHDCSKYYLCNHQQLVLDTCPAGLLWNQDHCDWPENTMCNNNQSLNNNNNNNTITEETKYKIVCYFTNWAWYRQGDGKYEPEDINPNLCTHIVYGFAVLDSNSLTMKAHDSWTDIDNEFYRKVIALKTKGVKVSIAIGGWNDSGSDKYSRLVNDRVARARFVTQAIHFIDMWGFDGLDLDWEYPKCWQVDCSKGPDSDASGFVALVEELSEAFRGRGWLLSSAVSPSKEVIDAAYNVPKLAHLFDWIAVMTYDFHGHWDKRTGHVAPLYYSPGGDTNNYFNANFSLHYWMEKGAPANKLVMGMPLYGQSFTLANSTIDSGLNAKAYGPGEAGEFTRAAGFLSFYEICDRVKRHHWTVTRDHLIGPYARFGNQWVSYDDVAEIQRKSQLVKELGLAGAMVWALDLDDFRNRCACGKHPLLNALNQELNRAGPELLLHNCT